MSKQVNAAAYFKMEKNEDRPNLGVGKVRYRGAVSEIPSHGLEVSMYCHLGSLQLFHRVRVQSGLHSSSSRP